MRKIILITVVLFSSVFVQAQLKIGGTVPEIELPNAVDSMVKLSAGQSIFFNQFSNRQRKGGAIHR
jgi:hypothetical protein